VKIPATRGGWGWGWPRMSAVTLARWVAGADGKDAGVVTPRRFQRHLLR
jgi:hypothetical protein